MIEKIWRIAIVTSGLGGVSAFVFWSLYKEWLSLSVFSKLDPDHTFYILFAFLFLTFFSMIIILSTFIKVRTFEHKRQDIEDALHKVTGGITLPSEKQKVNKKIECSGFLLNLQPNIHAWIVIEVDNEFWPKLKPKPNKKGEWKETVLEYGN